MLLLPLKWITQTRVPAGCFSLCLSLGWSRETQVHHMRWAASERTRLCALAYLALVGPLQQWENALVCVWAPLPSAGGNQNYSTVCHRPFVANSHWRVSLSSSGPLRNKDLNSIPAVARTCQVCSTMTAAMAFWTSLSVV